MPASCGDDRQGDQEYPNFYACPDNITMLSLKRLVRRGQRRPAWQQGEEFP
jgi:hypothetical protein